MQNHEYVTQNVNGIMGLNVLYQTKQIQWYLNNSNISNDKHIIGCSRSGSKTNWYYKNDIECESNLPFRNV